MSQDYLFCKNRLFVDQLDKKMHRKLNQFTQKDMLSILLDKVFEFRLRHLYQLRKWDDNLEDEMMSNPVMD